MRNRSPPEAVQEPERLTNREMHLKDDKAFGALPLPACYGDYGGGVMCLACDLRQACARLTAGDRERI